MVVNKYGYGVKQLQVGEGVIAKSEVLYQVKTYFTCDWGVHSGLRCKEEKNGQDNYFGCNGKAYFKVVSPELFFKGLNGWDANKRTVDYFKEQVWLPYWRGFLTEAFTKADAACGTAQQFISSLTNTVNQDLVKTYGVKLIKTSGIVTGKCGCRELCI